MTRLLTQLLQILVRKIVKNKLKGTGSILILLLVLGFSSYERQFSRGKNSATPTLHNNFESCHLQHLSDGDSFHAVCQKQDVHVRLFGIDAPESKQAPWGDISKKSLNRLIGSDLFWIKVIEKDRYGRYVAKVFLEGKDKIDVGLEQVKLGNAVVYHRYNDELLYAQAEKIAKASRIGIWSKPGPQQDPEKWRRLNPR